ncbi:MAG TPA: helix-turn-helix domain-containing protein [Gemmataceae bacterium]|nr:helix-turn-helix domain-containing protein [Gemmataceae bacterium]
MTTDRPPSGSPWATHCPDAYPIEWYNAFGLSTLPPGFTRFATGDEVALIDNTITEAEFRVRTGRGAVRVSTTRPPATGKGDRFRMLNGFIDWKMRDLSRAELAVWLVIYRDVKADTGTATVSQASLAERAGVTVRCVQKALKKLVKKRLLTVVRRGRVGAGASVYRVMSSAKCEVLQGEPGFGL